MATRSGPIIKALLPVASMDEVFICGPEAMIEATEKALIEAGVPDSRVYTERFTSGPAQAAKIQADTDAAPTLKQAAAKDIALTIVLDGKQHELHIGADEHVLDAALDAGLDLPFSCKAGVCCTCRAKVHVRRGGHGQELHPGRRRDGPGLRTQLPGTGDDQAS
jgi:ring-1,2-phenylacetyl-CoA epoxidase subunit PaaE